MHYGISHSSITQENSDDLERTQKTLTKLLLKEESYENALVKLNLDELAKRREKISLKSAKDCVKFNTMNDLLIGL